MINYVYLSRNVSFQSKAQSVKTIRVDALRSKIKNLGYRDMEAASDYADQLDTILELFDHDENIDEEFVKLNERINHTLVWLDKKQELVLGTQTK